jgi:Icc-related predicted phosphoesterase
MRVAAIGDLHVGTDSRGLIAPGFADIDQRADVLLLAGDLTRTGATDEIDVFIDELADVTIPKVAVLGNHDHHADLAELIVARCQAAGIDVLDGSSVVVRNETANLGIAGIKGFAGGFPGTSISAFGEPEMKRFATCARLDAERLEHAMCDLDDLGLDHVIVLLHYSPVRATLDGEPLEIYPLLGNGHLAEVVDRHSVDLVVHGHAHHGVEFGTTPGGVPVRNVAQPVIRSCYRIYRLREPE